MLSVGSVQSGVVGGCCCGGNVGVTVGVASGGFWSVPSAVSVQEVVGGGCERDV